MSIIGQQVFAAPGQVFSTISGGGGGSGTGPQIITSTILASNAFQLGPNATSTTSATFYGDDTHRLVIGSSDANSALYHQNGTTTDAAFIAFNGNNGYMSLVDHTGAVGLTLSSIQDGINIPVDLKVSSINGVAPGGSSIPANLVVSTITGQPGNLDTDANAVLRQASDGSGRTQLAYNISDRIGFGTYPILCPTAPSGVQMGYLACALDSNAQPAGFAIGGDQTTSAQGALVFNDSTGNNNDDWVIGGGGGMTHFAKNSINFSTLVVDVPTTLSSQNLLVSSINGSAYPPAAAPTPPGYYQWIPEQQTIGSGTLPNILNYSTITPSPVFSTTTGFTLSGSLTCSVEFTGVGNTNPVQNVAQTSNASFGLYMILDGNQIPLTSLSFTTTNNTSPAGQYNSAAPSYNSNTNLGAFIVQPNYNFNSATASPGVEFTYTALGAHTFQLFAWTDLFMSSADPGANYSTTLRFPRSADLGTTGILVQYH